VEYIFVFDSNEAAEKLAGAFGCFSTCLWVYNRFLLFSERKTAFVVVQLFFLLLLLCGNRTTLKKFVLLFFSLF
jgi:hypothetical protein